MRRKLIYAAITLSLLGGLFLVTAGLRTPADADPGHPHKGSCSLCFTCGIPWKNFEGSVESVSGADERGSGCAGPAAVASGDTFPFLCCK